MQPCWELPFFFAQQVIKTASQFVSRHHACIITDRLDLSRKGKCWKDRFSYHNTALSYKTIALIIPEAWDHDTQVLPHILPLASSCGYSFHISTNVNPQEWKTLRHSSLLSSCTFQKDNPGAQLHQKEKKKKNHQQKNPNHMFSFWRFLQRTCYQKYVEVGRKHRFCDVRLQNREIYSIFWSPASPPPAELLQFRAVSFVSFMGPGPAPEDGALSDNAGYFFRRHLKSSSRNTVVWKVAKNLTDFISSISGQPH